MSEDFYFYFFIVMIETDDKVFRILNCEHSADKKKKKKKKV